MERISQRIIKEIYFDLEWVKFWDKELITMNRSKRGRPYEYLDSMIEFQLFFVQKFTLRGAEAITRKLEEHGLIPKFNDHATS